MTDISDAAEHIVELLSSFSEEDRQEIIDMVSKTICLNCGQGTKDEPHPDCRCMEHYDV